MRTFPDVRMRELQALRTRLNEAAQAGDHESALGLARELRGQLTRYGLESGWTHWVIAVALDNLNKPADALLELRKAMTMDPLDTTFRRSFDIIINRLRGELATLPPDDASVLRIYNLLAQSGSNDVQTHLAMARHHLAQGRRQRARELLEALTLLAPISRDVWLERARLERLEGNEAAAARCDAQSTAAAASDVLFNIPRQ